MMTKEQERKALSQIENILNACDPDGYVATAFDGCVEMAATNIDCDWLGSMKAERDAAQRHKESFLVENKEQAKQIDEQKKKINQLQEDLNKEHNDRMQEIVKLTDKYNEQLTVNETLNAKVQDLEQQIIQLKAKLYDLLIK